MVDITAKNSTLRKAIATARLRVSTEATMQAIRENRVPKGNVFEFSRAAGLLAVKKTSDVIPDCHPLPVEFASITHTAEGLDILIRVEVHTIYKTGVEVEAMHGAAITALTMYDMLKPIDKQVEIHEVKLEGKSGGKTDKKLPSAEGLKVAVIVCSDRVSMGQADDLSGKRLMEGIRKYGLECAHDEVIPDDVERIRSAALSLVERQFDLIVLTGGTGLSERDFTPEAIGPLLDREIPGIMETARAYGQQRMPYAMLSRGVAGMIGRTLVITMPGSPKGVQEYLDALFPQVLHVLELRENPSVH